MVTATSTGIVGAEAAKVLRDLTDPSHAPLYLPFIASSDPLTPHSAVWHLSAEFVALVRERTFGATSVLEEDSRVAWKALGGQCSVEGVWTVHPVDEHESRVTLAITWRIKDTLRTVVETPLRGIVGGHAEVSLERLKNHFW